MFKLMSVMIVNKVTMLGGEKHLYMFFVICAASSFICTKLFQNVLIDFVEICCKNTSNNSFASRQNKASVLSTPFCLLTLFY